MKWIEERTRESHKTILRRKSMICERSTCRDLEIKRVRQDHSPDSEMHFEVRRRAERLFGRHRIFQVSVARFELSLTPPYVSRHSPFTAYRQRFQRQRRCKTRDRSTSPATTFEVSGCTSRSLSHRPQTGFSPFPGAWLFPKRPSSGRHRTSF